MHGDVVDVGARDDRGHARIREAPRHVVDDARPRADAGLRGRGAHGVDAHGDPLRGELPHDGQHTPELLVGVHAEGARPGRLPAHVHEVGTRDDHPAGVRERVVEGEVAAAVAEGVGGRVEDPHDERARRGHGHARPAAVGSSASTSARAAGSAREPRAAIVMVVLPACRVPAR
ncbi:hypothetical protein MAFF212519_24280 [Clavibacter michiganensis]